MSRCEVCEKPATHCCGGLDVPMLHFCPTHAEKHAQECPDVIDDRAQVVVMAREVR